MEEFRANGADSRRFMVFCVGSDQGSIYWSKIHKKLALTYSEPNPMITHVHRLVVDLFHFNIEKCLRGSVVNLDWYWGLMMPHLLKGYGNWEGLLSVDLACTNFCLYHQAYHYVQYVSLSVYRYVQGGNGGWFFGRVSV